MNKEKLKIQFIELFKRADEREDRVEITDVLKILEDAQD